MQGFTVRKFFARMQNPRLGIANVCVRASLALRIIQLRVEQKKKLPRTGVPIKFWIEIATDTECPRNDTGAESCEQACLFIAEANLSCA